MNTYIITIITVAVISGIVSSMLPDGDSTTKKHVNFITGLIFAIALLSPIVKIAKNADMLTDKIENAITSLDVNDNVSSGNSIIIEAGAERIEKGIKEALISKFGFKQEDISIKLAINDEKIDAVLLEKITITLSQEATWTDGNQIKKYVEELVGCPVKIIKI